MSVLILCFYSTLLGILILKKQCAVCVFYYGVHFSIILELSIDHVILSYEICILFTLVFLLYVFYLYAKYDSYRLVEF